MPSKKNMVLVLAIMLAVLVGAAMAAERISIAPPTPAEGAGQPPPAATPTPVSPSPTATPTGNYDVWDWNWQDPATALPAGMASGSTHLSGGMYSLIWPDAADYAENYGYLRALTPLRSDQWALHICEDRHLRASNGMSLAVSLTGTSMGAWLIAERAYIDPCLGLATCTAQPYFVYRINGLVDGRDFSRTLSVGGEGGFYPLVFNVLFRQKDAAVLPTGAITRGLDLDRKQLVYFTESLRLPPEEGSNITMMDFTGPRMGVKNSTNYYDEVCLMLTVGGGVYYGGAGGGAWNALSTKFALPDLESYSWEGTEYWLLCSPIPESGGYLRQDLEEYLPHDPGDVPEGMEGLVAGGDDYYSYGMPSANAGF